MQTETANLIGLTGGAYYITETPTDAYRVLSGSVHIYVVPWTEGQPGRRSLICTAEQNTIFPAFSHTDAEGGLWRFLVTPAEEHAQLERLEGLSTGPLQKKFLGRTGIENPGRETYGNLLVDRYRLNLVQEDGYLIRTDKEKEDVRARTDEMIASFFSKEKDIPRENGEHPVYQLMAELCHRMRIPIAPYEKITSCCRQEISVEEVARISHIPCRKILLEENWHKADAGPIMVQFGREKEPAVCIPRGRGKYLLCRSGKKAVPLTRALAEQCDPQAYIIYRPFPLQGMTAKDLAAYCWSCLSRADLAVIIGLTILSALIGLLIPTLNQMLYDRFIPSGQMGMVFQICCLVGAFMVGNLLFSVVKSLATFRLDSRIQYDVQNAVYHRIFELPENFFRNYESADLAQRVMELGSLVSSVSGMLLGLGLSLISALFYGIRMFTYSPQLSLVSLSVTLLFSLISYLLARRRMVYQAQVMEMDGKSSSLLFQFLLGIEKIRTAGVEERTIFEYMRAFMEQRRLETRLGRLSNLSALLSSASSGIFLVLIYWIAAQSASITMGSFVGFNSAFGMVSGAISSLFSGLISYQLLKPTYRRVKAILETVPEGGGDKRLPGQLTGSIDLDHVAFSYDPETPPVFRDLSLHIRPGEYVGIVGASGCGKSTLLKLLLGFEKATSGRIYYDDQDMDELDLQELRKHFGVVLQDGELISGSIFENITLTAPNAGRTRVEQVVEAVGLARDIQEMPMGLETMVSEHCNTISGGQKQRILIARAIINRPNILFFDEATSALDNLTQAQVCKALEEMGSTRVVIAHRLSTIQSCDRILVMDHGDIVEEGNYEQLMAQGGLFHELASRQIL